MPKSMGEILAEIKPVARKLRPGQLARLCGDFDFDGRASHDEMTEFWELAWNSFGNKSGMSMARTMRSVSMFRFKSLLNLGRSKSFPHLDVYIVFYQALIRMLAPWRVNQMEFGLCGPIHCTILVIRTLPSAYVQLVADLLTNGRSTGADGSELVVSEAVRSYDPAGAIPQVDWLVAASLFNLESVPKTAEERAAWGGTRGPDVARFCRFFGFGRYVSITSYEDSFKYLLDKIAHKTVLTSGYEEYHPSDTRACLDAFFGTKGKNLVDPVMSIRLAQTLHRAGWGVLLKVTAAWASVDEDCDLEARVQRKCHDNYKTYCSIYEGEALEKAWREFVAQKLKLEEAILAKERQSVKANLGKTKFVFGFLPAGAADHWVLVRSIAIDESAGSVALTLYTWGGKRAPMVVPLEDFAKGCSGFVAAMANSTLKMLSSTSLEALSKLSPGDRGVVLPPLAPSAPLFHRANLGRVARVRVGAPDDLARIHERDARDAELARALRQSEPKAESKPEASLASTSSETSRKGEADKGAPKIDLLGNHYYTEDEIYRLMVHYLGARPNLVVLHGIGEYQFSRLGPDAYRHATHAAINDATTDTIVQPLNVHGNHWGLLYIRLLPVGADGVRPARVLYIDPLNPQDVPDLSPLRRALPQLEAERSVFRYQHDGAVQHSCGAWIVALAFCLGLYADVLPPPDEDPRQAAIELRQMNQDALAPAEGVD